MSNIYYWEKRSRKTGLLKTCQKSKLLRNKIWRNVLALKNKKVYSGKDYFDIIVFSWLSSIKACLRFLLICFVQEIKGFYQSSLGNEVDFRDIMNVSPNILAKNWNFKKLRHGLVDERALITTTLISSCHWKTLVSFCLWKKRPENAFLTLIVTYRKIGQKNKLCPPEQR